MRPEDGRGARRFAKRLKVAAQASLCPVVKAEERLSAVGAAERPAGAVAGPSSGRWSGKSTSPARRSRSARSCLPALFIAGWRPPSSLPASRRSCCRAGSRRRSARGCGALSAFCATRPPSGWCMFEEQFPEAIDLMARALRAGHALTTSLQMVGEEVPGPGRAEISAAVRAAELRHVAAGCASKAFARRIPFIDARFFVTALLTQRETGGNLSEVLDNLACGHPRALQGEAAGARHERARPNHRLGAGAAAAGARRIVLFIVNPEQMRLLVEDPLGVYMVVGGAGAAGDRCPGDPEDRERGVLSMPVELITCGVSACSRPWRSSPGRRSRGGWREPRPSSGGSASLGHASSSGVVIDDAAGRGARPVPRAAVEAGAQESRRRCRGCRGG